MGCCGGPPQSLSSLIFKLLSSSFSLCSGQKEFGATLLFLRVLLERQAEVRTTGSAAIGFPGRFLGKSESPSDT